MEENLERLQEAKKQIDLVREDSESIGLELYCKQLSSTLEVIIKVEQDWIEERDRDGI